jgi:GGDEF domain-containing protein
MSKKFAACALRIVLLVHCLWGGASLAAPQLDISQQDLAAMRIDVRSAWQTAIIQSNSAPSNKPLDAQSIWELPEAQFKPGEAKPITIKPGERLIGRLVLRVGANPHTLLLDLPMQRLDLAHASFRYNDEPWTQASAGDQIPMVNRYPTFVIPPRSGELQIIVDIPATGLFPAPVLLWSDPAFRADHNIRNFESGTAITMSLFMVLFCIGAAGVLKRFAFVVLALYSISVLCIAAGQGGIIGQYVGTTTTWFNDYVKYVSGMIFGAMIPWTMSHVCSQKYYSKFIARFATFWMLASIATMLVMLFTVPRLTQWAILSPFLIASLVFGLGIALASALRGHIHGMLSLAGIVMLCIGIFAPIAAYWGYIDGVFSYIVTIICLFISNICFLLALLLQYRHGNLVISQASSAAQRDALTGLYNRATFERKYNHWLRRAKPGQAEALFLYVAVGDADQLSQEFGDVGFESGMVQIAATLSSCVPLVDLVARISNRAFGVVVVMSHNHQQGSEFAQKIITRIMTIANHSAPMAQTARIAAAWLPEDGQALTQLENSSRDVLQRMSASKRIGWFAQYLEASNPTDSTSTLNHPEAQAHEKAKVMRQLIDEVENSLAQRQR